MKTQLIKLAKIEHNDGQIDGLPKNPRKKDDEKFELLKKSLQDDPEMLELRELLIVPYKDKFVCIGGNMRLDALIELGVKEAPCKIIPEDTPVEKLKAYTIKDNASFGKWDFGSLEEDWDKLDLINWGIDESEFEALDSLDEEDPEVQEDDFDESEVTENIVKPLDVWRLGEHVLMCGDSTDVNDVAILMGEEKADLLITDPPYNVDYEGKTKEKLKIQNDKMGEDIFKEFLIKSFASADMALKPGGVFYIWHADSAGYTFRSACEENGWQVRQCLVWNKNTMVMGRQDYQWKHEPCLYGWKDGAAHYFTDSRCETTVLEFNKPSRSEMHPTMKPVEMFAYQIANSSRKNWLVLDLFGGSGTTIVACEQLGRRARIMEIDPHYCDVIIARWEKLTGGKAEKIN